MEFAPRTARARVQGIYRLLPTGLVMMGFAAGLTACVAARAEEPLPGLVLPPGQEDLFRRMLDPPGSPCTLAGIAVDRDQVRGSYRCGGTMVEVQLRPEASGPSRDGIRFAVTVPPDRANLGRVLEDSVHRLEGQARVDRPAAREPEPPAPQAPQAPPPEFDPEEQALYDRAEALVKAGRCPEALDLLQSMAQRRPVSQALGLMVVCLAEAAQDPARVREEVARAESRPDDPLAAFRAGVTCHYAGHRLADTREGKAAFYRDAIRFLQRTLPAFDDVTRVHLYLAVSHYRLGQQAEAEAEIERAVALAERTRDADAWYCRAEIRHRKDLAGALQDIGTYFEVMAPNIARGAIHSPAKQRRVRQMQARLERALAGTEPLGPDEDLFDPLPDPVTSTLRRHSRALGLAGVLVLAVGSLAALRWTLRRRSRSRLPAP